MHIHPQASPATTNAKKTKVSLPGLPDDDDTDFEEPVQLPKKKKVLVVFPESSEEQDELTVPANNRRISSNTGKTDEVVETPRRPQKAKAAGDNPANENPSLSKQKRIAPIVPHVGDQPTDYDEDLNAGLQRFDSPLPNLTDDGR
jgi:hypothetical protein